MVLAVGFSVTALSGVGFVVLLDLPLSTFELLFFAVPVAFVLFLCWEASKYYIIITDEDASEWSLPVDSGANESQGDTSDPENSGSSAEMNHGRQKPPQN
jgi:hypothetical protein